MEKKCIKCGKVLPFDDFYRHNAMADGHQNSCKSCVRIYSQKRLNEKLKDPLFVEKERDRHREKYYRLNYKEKHKPSVSKRDELILIYKERYPEKVLAKQKSSHLSRIVKGNHLHHWSYLEEFHKDVIELNPKDHYTIHRFISYDQERMMYRRIDTMELLDTRESSIEYYKMILKKDDL